MQKLTRAGLVEMSPEEIAALNPPQTPEQRKDALKTRIKGYGLSLRRAGFPWDFGTEEEPDLQVLQLREATAENDDEKNWMSSLSAYTTACVVGQGSFAGAQFRTESNAIRVLTYQDGMLVLLAMQGWCGLLVAEVWSKCDDVDAAADHEALDALEAAIETGWPV